MTAIKKSESVLSTFFCKAGSEEELERRARYLIHCINVYNDENDWQDWEDDEAKHSGIKLEPR
jgi:hypothetical protein